MWDASDLHFTQTWLILLCDLHYLTHLERYYAHVQTPLQLSLVALYIAPPTQRVIQSNFAFLQWFHAIVL